MKSLILTIAAVVASLAMMLFYSKASNPKLPTGYDILGFAELPVQGGGRVMPMDSVARNQLMAIRGKQALYEKEGDKKVRRAAAQWLLEANADPEKAAGYEIFRIDHEQVLGLIGKTQADGRKEFSLDEIRPHIEKIQTSLNGALEKPKEQRDEYDKGLLRLADGMMGYRSVASLLPQPVMSAEITASREFTAYDSTIKDARTEQEKKARGESADEAILQRLDVFQRIYQSQSAEPGTTLALIPPVIQPIPADAYLEGAIDSAKAASATLDRIHQATIPYREKVGMAMTLATQNSTNDKVKEVFDAYVKRWKPMVPWRTLSDALIAAPTEGGVDPVALRYAEMVDAYRENKPSAFNDAVTGAKAEFERRLPGMTERAQYEEHINEVEPFLRSMVLYVCVFLLAAVSWLVARRPLANAALILMVVAFVIQGYGLLARMEIMDRPLVWVTNLYSSAVFIGFVAVLLCIVLETLFRMGIGSACGAVIGFATLVVAHHLSRDGDTLAPLQAVLDTNFWLSTHVTTVTMGYSATYLAGALAVGFIVVGILRPNLPKKTMSTLAGMVYGIVCFALLFSTVGTLLGGIWADQSWGRFWGWDPKENGALMIVLWNALVLHARWGKIFGKASEWGVMCLCVFGNIVTSWSWFGTNLLGIGLHSYGFNSSTFWFLIGFATFNLAIITLGLLRILFVRPVKKPASTPTAHSDIEIAGTTA